MEPTPARPVWIVPAIAAALALLFLLVLAVERHDGGQAAPAATTTSTTTPAPPVDAPLGNRGNPFPIGASGELAGWRLTVLSSSRAGDVVTASVQLLWDGQDGVDGGAAKALQLNAQDAAGKLHPLGGAGCAASPTTDLASVPLLDIAQTATVSLCWTVPGLAQSAVALSAQVAGAPDVTVFALA